MVGGEPADATPYDSVTYPGYPYDYTHPERMATVASLFGMQPTPLSQCRVLEIGCGDGANLIPVAYQWPDSTFVGIDLSGSAIAQGHDYVGAVGLENVDLRHCNIMDVGADFGRFDYIIAHGVYSWVPPPVRDRMLALFGEHLTPHGVAYVSYNCLPGSHLRNLAREIMNYHVRGIDDPRQRIEQGRTILRAISEMSASDRIYGAVLRDQHERVSRMADGVLFHDDLSDVHQAFLLSEVIAAATRHGLQYLSDATFYRADLQRFSGPVRQLLQRFPDGEVVAREQYQDFIEGHMFRRTLLCRGEVALDRALTPDCLQRFHLAAEAVPENGPVDPTRDGVAAFKIEGAGVLSTDHTLTKAAVLYLGQIWPATVRLPELVEGALGLLGETAGAVRVRLDEEVEALTQALFQASRAGHITLHRYPPKLTTQIGERPRASLLARRQCEAGRLITSLQHAAVILEDAIVRRFLCLVDGTRTVDELVTDLVVALEGEELATSDGAEKPEIDRASVEKNLRLLSRLGLLEG